MASTAVSTAMKPAMSPPSTFSHLLRQSRFATFDPSVRQTYYSPPQHTQRGDWGLKRPLNTPRLRRRNAFISIPANMDERAGYVEWCDANSEVRWMRRWEEMETGARFRERSPWAARLGAKNSSTWVADSEFGFERESIEVEEMRNNMEKQEANVRLKEERQNKDISVEMDGLGLRGTGNYGARRQLVPSSVHIVPNIQAMSPKVFESYLRKLRTLRSEFMQFARKAWEDEQRAAELQKRVSEERKRRLSPTDLTEAEKDELMAGWVPPPAPPLVYGGKDYHRRFISHYTASTFSSPSSTSIEQRPHQLAGAQYAKLTPLHSHLYSTPQPGIVLQSLRKELENRQSYTVYVASFGGMTPIIRKDYLGNKTPLFNRTDPPALDRLHQSTAYMKLKPASVIIDRVPDTVGPPSLTNGLDKTHITSEAIVVDSGASEFSLSNPYAPGSPMYSGAEETRALSKAHTAEDEERLELKVKRDRKPVLKSAKRTKDPAAVGLIDILGGMVTTKME